MRVYLDTGVFIDYLTYRSHAGPFLRTSNRRGRDINQLSSDATECLNRIGSRHEGFTSSLTLYEVERTMFERLEALSKGLPDHYRYLIASARPLAFQILLLVDYHNISVIPLTKDIFENVVSNYELQRRGVQAGDSIHMSTAMMNDADLFISTDDDVLSLDSVFTNGRGGRIQCMDTDAALTIL